MGEFALKTKAWGNQDQRWLGNGGLPSRPNKDIVLDRSLFDLVGDFPDGVIPSGIALGKVTATGHYGPYSGSTTEVQSLTVGGSGLTSFTISYNGSTTDAIDDQATGADVKAALILLPDISENDIDVSGPAGGPWIVTFKGDLAGENIAQFTTTPTGGTGTVTPATTTAGGTSGSADGRERLAGFNFNTEEYDRDAASTADLPATLFVAGEVITTYLPEHNGLDEAGRADTPLITYVTDVVGES